MHNPYYLEAIVNILLMVLFLWTIPWKIYAVWTAAKRGEKKWFVALLFLNTISILELIYIFKIAKIGWPKVKQDFEDARMSMRKRK